MTTHKCSDNDNKIAITCVDGKPDELIFGMPDEKFGNGVVIGFKDLRHALEKAGVRIRPPQMLSGKLTSDGATGRNTGT
jgi:hypothetical protein